MRFLISVLCAVAVGGVVKFGLMFPAWAQQIHRQDANDAMENALAPSMRTTGSTVYVGAFDGWEPIGTVSSFDASVSPIPDGTVLVERIVE